jgi:tRNA nucleotidyltransferase (CCA-adding enzyme)
MRMELLSLWPFKILHILKTASALLEHRNQRGYLVGGMVRDGILGKPSMDVDISVEEDGIGFAQEFAMALGGKPTLYHEYLTASIHMEEMVIDVATTRRESYEKPGSLPKVFVGTLSQDVHRRDFTINALAMGLNRDNFGVVLDLCGGLEDLADGILRILHSESFVDDPTRILRGLRFAGRFGYVFEKQTLRYLKKAMKGDVFKTIASERIWREWELIFSERKASKILKKSIAVGLFSKIFPKLHLGEGVKALLEKEGRMKSVSNPTVWYSLILLWETPASDMVGFLDHMDKKTKTLCQTLPRAKKTMQDLIKKSEFRNPDAVFFALKPYGEELRTLLKMAGGKEFKSIYKIFTRAQKRAKVKLVGEDLKILGIEPGKIYGEIFRTIEKQRVLGNIRTRKQEIEFVKRQYS